MAPFTDAVLEDIRDKALVEAFEEKFDRYEKDIKDMLVGLGKKSGSYKEQEEYLDKKSDLFRKILFCKYYKGKRRVAGNELLAFVRIGESVPGCEEIFEIHEMPDDFEGPEFGEYLNRALDDLHKKGFPSEKVLFQQKAVSFGVIRVYSDGENSDYAENLDKGMKILGSPIKE